MFVSSLYDLRVLIKGCKTTTNQICANFWCTHCKLFLLFNRSEVFSVWFAALSESYQTWWTPSAKAHGQHICHGSYSHNYKWLIFGSDAAASGTYAVLLACVCVCVCGFGITIEDSNKGIPSPRSTIEWEQLVLDRHTMGELELLYRFIPLLQRGRQYSPRA